MTKKKIRIIIHKTINSKIQQGNIIFVSYGYARNYLIPKQIASLATSSILKQSYKSKKIQDQKSQQQYNSMRNIQHLLEQTNILSLRRKVNQDYRFFGSIISGNIIHKLLKITGIIIDKKQINLVSMRRAGTYMVRIQLSSELTANINIQIMPTYYI
uniref:50S ribosomal protein L9, chloroplastic n=1 Tax=Hildenbrandia rubra TaxID=31481 RepID=A0A1C9CG74_9FLOR|nr:ribosomal protein L9 [Hildenbrandia rubra]AOM67374.1 ribosomal protein L9 [Hildenbrandia rubra]